MVPAAQAEAPLRRSEHAHVAVAGERKANALARTLSSTAKPKFSPLVTSIIGGTVGGVAVTCMAHPVDTVKVRLQCQQLLADGPKSAKYSGSVDCVRQVVQADGLGGLYRGVASPLVGQMFFNACLIGTYDAVKRAMLRSSGQDELSNLELLGAGSITGAIAASVETPVDLFKSKMQLQALHLEAAQAQGKPVKPDFTSTWGCVQFVSRKWGLPGWYQGLHSTVLRNSVANGCFFSIYEILKRYLVRRQNGTRAGPAILLTAGAAGGFLCVAVSHPLDVVKSAIMSDNLADRKYRGVLDCAQKIYRQQGMGGFSKGLVPGLMRASIGNATLVLTVEMVRGYLNS